MSSAFSGRVVVGFDGRWQPTTILDVAADEAIRLGRPLSVVTLIHSPAEVASLTGRPEDGWYPLPQIRRTLSEAANHIRQRHETLRVATQGLYFSELQADAEPFASAVLLVLGDHGQSGGPDAGAEGLGAAARALRAATTCPELVVPVGHPSNRTKAGP